MTRHFLLIAFALFTAPLILPYHDAHACSCAPPRPRMLSPARLSNAPLNTHVRIALPSYLKGSLVFRKHQGPDVAFKRSDSPLRHSGHVELVPEKQLDPDTRYEVGLVNPEEHPTTFVFGTFVTGNAADTVAPTAPKITRSAVNSERWSNRTSCAVGTPWVQIFLNKSEDPGRTDSRVLYAVWSASGKEKIDLAAPPKAFIEENEGFLKLGQTSYCDPDEFPLPANGSVSVAIIAVDEAGNRSAVQRTSFVVSTPKEVQP